MGTTSFSPNFDAADTPTGVRYRLRHSRGYRPGFPLGWGCITAVPAAAAALAVAFLVAYFTAVSWTLLPLSCLFVVQMLVVARIPGRLAWQGLVVSFGHGVIELRGGRLLLGARAGPFWSRGGRPVQDFRGLTVYVYPDPKAKARPAAEYAALAVESAGAEPWHLVAGFGRDETLALAEDLRRRLEGAVAGAGAVTSLRLPPVAVVATTWEALYPDSAPAYSLAQKVGWVAMFAAGVVGLGALSVAVIRAEPEPAFAIRGLVLVVMAWVLEFILLGITVMVLRSGDLGSPKEPTQKDPS